MCLQFTGHTILLFAAIFAVVGRSSLSPSVVGLSLTYALSVSICLLQLFYKLYILMNIWTKRSFFLNIYIYILIYTYKYVHTAHNLQDHLSGVRTNWWGWREPPILCCLWPVLVFFFTISNYFSGRTLCECYYFLNW